MIDETCLYCDSPNIATGHHGELLTVCSKCPIGETITPELGLLRWRTWLLAHDIEFATAPGTMLPVLWHPPSRALVYLDPEPTDDDLAAAITLGVRRGWSVILLGHTLAEPYIVFDGDSDPAPDFTVAPDSHLLTIGPPAIFGACEECRQFQWHAPGGDWHCRACGHYDGNASLDPLTVHCDGLTAHCRACATLVLSPLTRPGRTAG